MPNSISVIDQMVQKYGGADEAYKQKLKEHIRDAFGYSNYRDQLDRELSGPASIGSVKGLSPNGINARINTRFGMQDTRVSGLQKAAGTIDSAAATLSERLAAKNKAADKYKYDTSFIFEPHDALDQKILDYARNPRNEDGSVKTVDQFEKELQKEYGSSVTIDQSQPVVSDPRMAGQNPDGQFSAKDIQDRVVQHLPADFSGKELNYSYRFQGMTEKQAAEEQLIDFANLIANGRGKEVPAEIYPMAYHLLSDAEKAKLRGYKSERAGALEGLGD